MARTKPKPETPFAPHDVEAEMAYLGSLLHLNGKEIGKAVQAVAPLELFLPAHARLLESCVPIAKESGRIDRVSLASHLYERGVLEDIGGPEYIIRLEDWVPVPGNWAHYAKIVRELWQRRCLMERAGQLARDCINPEYTTADIVLRAQGLGQGVATGDAAGLRSYIGIARKEVSWLWKPYFPLGAVSSVIGDPGIGKSSFAYALAAMVSRGSANARVGFPAADPADVLLYCLEDDPERVIGGRLDRQGADCERVHDGVYHPEHNPLGIEPPITLEKMARVIKMAEGVPGLRLVIFDPVSEWFPANKSANTANEAREVLRLFRTLAEQRGLCTLILGHPNKQQGTRLMYRVANSLDFSAVVRSGLFATDVPDSQDKALIHFKRNWGPQGKPIGYAIGEDGGFSFTESPDVSEESVRAADTHPQKAVPAWVKDAAKKFLATALADGPLMANDLFEGAQLEGIGKRTLKTAKAEMGIDSRKLASGWEWALPDTKGKRQYWQDKEDDNDPFARE